MTNINNNNIRIIIYVSLLVLFIMLIIVRQQAVRTERSQIIQSTISEWNKHGKPVVVLEVVPQEIKEYSKFTVVLKTDNSADGFVTREIGEKIKSGQAIYVEYKGIDITGKVAQVSRDVDMETGMFDVSVKFDKPIKETGSILVVCAHTRTFHNVLAVPDEALDIENEEFYVWKIKNGRAKKVKVDIASRNSYGAIISNGLGAGDLVVYRGGSQLKNKDAVCCIIRE